MVLWSMDCFFAMFNFVHRLLVVQSIIDSAVYLDPLALVLSEVTTRVLLGRDSTGLKINMWKFKMNPVSVYDDPKCSGKT